MAFVKRVRTILTVTATGGAAQTFYSSAALAGLVQAVRYMAGPATAPSTAAGSISTDAHLALSAELSGVNILDCSATASGVTYYPRGRANNTGSGIYSPATGAGAGVGWPVEIPLGQERLKIVVSSGGAASGTTGLLGAVDLYIEGA